MMVYFALFRFVGSLRSVPALFNIHKLDGFTFAFGKTYIRACYYSGFKAMKAGG